MSIAKIYKYESFTTPFVFVGYTTETHLPEKLTFYRSEYKIFKIKTR